MLHSEANGTPTCLGHVAFLSSTGDEVPVTIHSFHGDYSGFLHVMDGMRVTIVDSDSPFPSAFALYDGGIFKPPPCKISRKILLHPMNLSIKVIKRCI